MAIWRSGSRMARNGGQRAFDDTYLDARRCYKGAGFTIRVVMFISGVVSDKGR